MDTGERQPGFLSDKDWEQKLREHSQSVRQIPSPIFLMIGLTALVLTIVEPLLLIVLALILVLLAVIFNSIKEYRSSQTLTQRHPEQEFNDPEDTIEFEAVSDSRHAKAHRLTLASGVLSKEEVVKFDGAPHWIYLLIRLLRPKTAIAYALIVFIFFLPNELWWVKLLVVSGSIYWIGFQIAPALWTRHIVTDQCARLIFLPWRILGERSGYSIRVKTLNTANYKQPMWMVILCLNCATVMLDGPGDQDKMFNNIEWVRHWKAFLNTVDPEGKVTVDHSFKSRLPRLRQRMRS